MTKGQDETKVTIKDVPMVTDDQVEIKLNSVLYTVEWNTGYEFKKEGTFKIEAHRVISLDNTRRFFRTRCIKGCETEQSFAKGCNRSRLFGTVDAAKEELKQRMEDDIKKCDAKVAQVIGTSKHIESRKLEMLDFVLQDKLIPKAIVPKAG